MSVSPRTAFAESHEAATAEKAKGEIVPDYRHAFYDEARARNIAEQERTRPKRTTDERKRKADRVRQQMRRTVEPLHAVGGDDVWTSDPVVVLEPKVIVTPTPPLPEELFPVTLIPIELEAPTAKLTGLADGRLGGEGMPWTTGPPSLLLVAPVIGALLISQGKKVLIAMALSGIEYAGMQLLNQVTLEGKRRGIRTEWRTGKGPGRGRYLRPRPESGEMAGNDSDPYDNPKEFSLFDPWTWF